jgi:hypothetical protein
MDSKRCIKVIIFGCLKKQKTRKSRQKSSKPKQKNPKSKQKKIEIFPGFFVWVS